MRFRMALEGDWDKIQNFDGDELAAAIRRGMRSGVRLGAVLVQGAIRKNIAQGRSEWKKLHPWTVERRGGDTAPLRDDGDLMGGIHVQFPSEDVALIGVSRGTKGKDGGDLVSIGAVHEFGATIGVTDKMRGWLHAHGMHLSPDTTHITIPARPFVRPAWEESQEEIAAIFEDEIQAEIRALVGR